MLKKTAPKIDVPFLRARLKLKNIQSETLLKAHHTQAIAQLEAAGVRPGSLRSHSAKLLTTGAAVATFMISSPQSIPLRAALPPVSTFAPLTASDLQQSLSFQLRQLLPPRVQRLDPNLEPNISQLIHNIFGIHATAELEGNRLNTSYGYIGAEQHLPRYPGDTAAAHQFYVQSGITPGRGAWGYFAGSAAEMTPQLEEYEKYYVAVQTLYLPDWTTRLAYLRDWYKYRKVIVINPDNGKAVIAVVADSGPAAFTGKQFGGSPEVMAYLNRKDGRQRGPVLLFFVDDPQNQVRLGPLETNLEHPPLLTSQ